MSEPIQTHHADCWQTRGHHACAIAKIEALREVAGDLDAALNGPDYRNDRERMDEVARIVARIERLS